MDRIGDIIRQTSSDGRHKSKGRYVCEICRESYDYTDTLSLPNTGDYGYQLYDTCSERCICVCEDCVDALQEIINARAESQREAAENGKIH